MSTFFAIMFGLMIFTGIGAIVVAGAVVIHEFVIGRMNRE